MAAFGGAQESDARTDLIGRRGELDAVERSIERARTGLASIVLVGEPGIGKTSLWREAVRLASDGGARILRSAPAESERGLSLGGLTDLLAEVSSDDLSAAARRCSDTRSRSRSSAPSRPASYPTSGRSPWPPRRCCATSPGKAR